MFAVGGDFGVSDKLALDFARASTHHLHSLNLKLYSDPSDHWRSWLARLHDTEKVTGSSPVWFTEDTTLASREGRVVLSCRFVVSFCRVACRTDGSFCEARSSPLNSAERSMPPTDPSQ